MKAIEKTAYEVDDALAILGLMKNYIAVLKTQSRGAQNVDERLAVLYSLQCNGGFENILNSLEAVQKKLNRSACEILDYVEEEQKIKQSENDG